MCFIQVDPTLDLHIVSPDPSTEQSVILWTKENIDDEQFERAASMVSCNACKLVCY